MIKLENILDKTMMHAFVECFIGWLNCENVEFEQIYQTMENYLTKGIVVSVLQNNMVKLRSFTVNDNKCLVVD